MASLNQIPAAPALGISASRVGAEAVLPGDSRMPTDARKAQSPNTTAGVGIEAMRGSNPNLSPVPPNPSGAGGILGTLRGSAIVPRPAASPSNSGSPRSRSHPPSNPPSNPQLGAPAPSQAPYPVALRTPPAGSQPLGTSSDGLRPSAQRLPPTKLGIGPPPRGPAFQPVEPRVRRTWLVIAILLVIAAAVALAIAVIGT
jgi:hypothetical protein